MGLLSWWKGNSGNTEQNQPDPNPNPNPAPADPAPGMNGAVEVPRSPAAEEEEAVTLFEFGSVAASADKVTLAGFCPVSDQLEPCRWEILPATDDDAPQFRLLF